MVALSAQFSLLKKKTVKRMRKVSSAADGPPMFKCKNDEIKNVFEKSFRYKFHFLYIHKA